MWETPPPTSTSFSASSLQWSKQVVQTHPRLATKVLRRDPQWGHWSEVEIRHSPMTGTLSCFFPPLCGIPIAAIVVPSFCSLVACSPPPPHKPQKYLGNMRARAVLTSL